MREKQFNVRCTNEEWARLERVANHHGVNPANVVRLLVKREDEAIKNAKKLRR